jgi:hypothetical protein
MLDSIGGLLAWENTRAIRLQMNSNRPLILWDRDRGFAELTYKKSDERILLNTQKKSGIAFSGNERLKNPEEAQAVERAYADFVNDTFWLTAPFKIRDSGTRRHIVENEGRDQLLVEYLSGGTTPGDAYLWELDPDGRPLAWRMWVEILPIKGIRVNWSDWKRTDTGIFLAARRQGPLGLAFDFQVMDTARALLDLEPSREPFESLVMAGRAETEQP